MFALHFFGNKKDQLMKILEEWDRSANALNTSVAEFYNELNNKALCKANLLKSHFGIGVLL